MLNITYYLKKNLLVKSEASHLISVTVPTVLEPHGVYLFLASSGLHSYF